MVEMPNFWGVLGASTPAQWCQAYYILASVGILALSIVPESVQGLVLDYGARSSAKKVTEPKGFFESVVRLATSFGQIPHSWFIHFYVAAVGGSLFWASQYVTHGDILRSIATRQSQDASASMTLAQVELVWTLFFIQGSRRLYEHITTAKSSTSKMWFMHWLMGLSFYLITAVAVWVEGSADIFDASKSLESPDWPPLPSLLAAALFLAAGFKQHQYHEYLSSLVKYSLPDREVFQYILCPHYTCECILYLALAVAGAPPGSTFNRSLLCALLFVCVNLGVTANGTKKWYLAKFGEDKISKRWKMIPPVF